MKKNEKEIRGIIREEYVTDEEIEEVLDRIKDEMRYGVPSLPKKKRKGMML